jgi:DNA repair exonuclease SbcCD ATPase subunit
MVVEEDGEVTFRVDTATEAELVAQDKETLVMHLMSIREKKQIMQKEIDGLVAALKGAEMSVAHLETQSNRVQDAHERELGLMFDESIAVRSELEYKGTELKLENQRMKDEVAAYTVIEEQNKTLRSALEAQQKESEETSTRLQKEIEDLKESVIEHKNKLQKEFRNRLQAMSKTMHDEVLTAYHKDRAAAGIGVRSSGGGAGSGAGADVDDHNQHVSVMMERYAQLEARHTKMKLEHGLAQQSMETQTKQMLQLKRELLESRERCASLESDLKAVRAEAQAVRQQARKTQKHRQARTPLARTDVPLGCKEMSRHSARSLNQCG